ncbi:MAG: hypothetical protein LUH21_03870 [Clostridiales bacterium]|nr:hypothetical protein [Clostridiales bacterium]
MEKELSSNIPPAMKEEILVQGEENFEITVYRVAKWGIDDSRSFLGSYDEYLINPNGSTLPDINEIGGYSTSCNLTPKRPKKILKCLKQKYNKIYPRPVVIVGNPLCGLSQETHKRIPNYKDKTHVDWWIYLGSDQILSNSFKLYEPVIQK